MVTRDTPWPAGTPCWVDLMTTDPAAAREFYAALFGWEIEVGGEETGGYAMASLGGRSTAGIGALMDAGHPPVWATYLATDDVDATCAAAEKGGASIVTPAMEVMDFGRLAVGQLPGGGVFGLWEAGTHIGVAAANEANTLCWNEFLTRDYDGAKAFYADLFGYTYTSLGLGGMDYSMIEVDGVTVGGIGGMPPGMPDAVPPHWRVYFAVEDADAAVAEVVAHGGSVLRPAEDMPYGRHADVADPQGAAFAVITPAAPDSQ